MQETPTAEQLEEHLLVFSLTPGASLEEIKKRKAFMVKVMHEDVVAENMKDQAREEMVRINNAWEAINSWFKANPGQTTTPIIEKKSASTSNSKTQGGATADADDEDWEAFEKRKRTQWNHDGVSLEQLDRKRRTDIQVRSRRDLVVKAKISTGVILGLWFFTLCFGSNDVLYGARVFCLISIIAYWTCLLNGKIKAKIEAWIEKVD